MFPTLIFLHSIFRWLVLFGLVNAVFVAFRGFSKNLNFSKKSDLIRHWTATIAHIQLMIGFTLYTQSPLVKYYFTNPKTFDLSEISFFSIIHGSLMLVAIIIITIGSALAKRKVADRDKFKTMAIYYSIALLIIFVAIPWPFSPLSQRPFIRLF
ncbi:hypothetical protein [Dyadobacter fanqingshengii]|uniref:Cytochrome B n=1 Tax=Dyadobacter fanqingshengii TaxID=2906443 RepID=A0A9X1PFC6_9BACT|nr:hypothetical protein [Dyadobacter fanqingshengii]MCF0043079.1 hypothetical protein [Dyadobacter fanqingshengii]USJ35632.1 hypothetical protein NFI81_23450 [Dyadobacter fanqingshengii]